MGLFFEESQEALSWSASHTINGHPQRETRAADVSRKRRWSVLSSPFSLLFFLSTLLFVSSSLSSSLGNGGGKVKVESRNANQAAVQDDPLAARLARDARGTPIGDVLGMEELVGS